MFLHYVGLKGLLHYRFLLWTLFPIYTHSIFIIWMIFLNQTVDFSWSVCNKSEAPSADLKYPSAELRFLWCIHPWNGICHLHWLAANRWWKYLLVKVLTLAAFIHQDRRYVLWYRVLFIMTVTLSCNNFIVSSSIFELVNNELLFVRTITNNINIAVHMWLYTIVCYLFIYCCLTYNPNAAAMAG